MDKLSWKYCIPLFVIFFLLKYFNFLGGNKYLKVVTCWPNLAKEGFEFPLSKSGKMEVFAYSSDKGRLYEYNFFKESYIPAKKSKSKTQSYNNFGSSTFKKKVDSLFVDGNLKIIKNSRIDSLGQATRLGRASYKIFDAKKDKESYRGTYSYSGSEYNSGSTSGNMTCKSVRNISIKNEKSIRGPKPPSQPDRVITIR